MSFRRFDAAAHLTDETVIVAHLNATALATLASPAPAVAEYQGVLAIDTASAGCAFNTARADDVTVGEQIRIYMHPNDIGGNSA